MQKNRLNDAKNSRRDRLAARSMRQFSMAFGLYLLWAAIVWLAIAAGQLSLSSQATLILLTGIVVTNALFFLLARSGTGVDLGPAGVAAAQCLFGIGWATAFMMLAVGGSQLSLGMFICANLFALSQVRRQIFIALAAVAGGCYAIATLTRYGISGDTADLRSELLNLAILLGVMGWLTLFASYLDELRQQLQDRNAELRQHIKKVVRIAEQDQLTKSFNRRYIMDTLAREKGRADRSNTPVSVCVFNLDHLKAKNDEYGELVGDRLLKSFAKRVRGELRTMDTSNPTEHRRSFGRVGGEEFIAILPSTPLTGAGACGERIRAAVADRPFDDVLQITVSVGVAEYRRGETVPELLARAEEALHRAKAEGRNCVVLDGKPERRSAQIFSLKPSNG
ncbi:MAG: diguanylate cyclase [Gammaproteobacteria bacterium]